MRQTLTLPALTLCIVVSGQTVLFSEDFESVSPAFTLNTTDVNSTASSPDNTWLINNAYSGGSGSVICIGFPFPFTVPNTAPQPAGITSPNGRYLHTTSIAAQNSGIQNCCFIAGDGFCTQAANHFARMSADVSTVGASQVTLSFWWLCGGGTNNYGEVYYSTNAGTSWTLVTAAPNQYRNQGTWTQQTISLPEFAGHATLRFGFRFMNGVTASAADPGFGIDDVVITSSGAAPPTVEPGAISPLVYCAGAAISVPYTATGTYEGGNVFTAQLSDAFGSFATPVSIGSVASTASGTIAATVPPGTPTGNGYRVRVVSSAPVITSGPNAANITVSEAPFAGSDTQVILCTGMGSVDLFPLLGPGVSDCGGWTGPGGIPFSGILNTSTGASGNYTYTTDCPGACPQDQATVAVTLVPDANAGDDVQAGFCASGPAPDLPALVNNGQPGGQFLYQGQPSPLPDWTVPGTYVLQYVISAPPPCSSDVAIFTITIGTAANAGQGASIQLCINGPVVQLLSFLTDADAGGTWSGPDGMPFSGTLDPASGASGLYTYTVQGTPPCPIDQSFVAVVIDPCLGVGETDTAAPIRWLGQVGEGEHLFSLPDVRIVGTEVFDASGRAVRRVLPSQQHEHLRLSFNAATGTYVVRIHTDMGTTVVRLVHTTW